MPGKPINIIGLLLFGAFFLYLSNGRFSIAFAAWLFPIFLLQVSRNEKKIFSYLVIPLIFGICSQLSFWKFTYSHAGNILFYIPLTGGLIYGLLFFIDHLAYSKIKGFAATLIFPLAYTSFDFLLNLFNPFGSTGILGYSQFEFLSFSQLAAITGMCGLTFMVTWFSSVISWFINNDADRKSAKRGITIYLSILVLILVYGGIRLQLPLQRGTIKISALHTHDKDVEGIEMQQSLEKKDTIAFKKISNAIVQQLINTTIIEARAGAKIIMWSEISPKILKTDEDSLALLLKTIAQQQKIYLMATPFSVVTNGSKSENKILLFSPTGELVLKHTKYGGNFMEGTVEGDKTIKTVSTPYGKLSALICWDADFPSIVKQAGKSNTDILLIPASDWKEIDPLHTIIAIFRGIENGCSVVRQTRNGLSIMTGPTGKIIAQVDHFGTGSWVMTGQVPNKKIWALYPIIGDLFGWLAISGLAAMLLWAFRKTKKRIAFSLST
ncbi:MAG: nitrilase-related carbon-nitrogen hydrolase [Ferruginibacter sp.]